MISCFVLSEEPGSRFRKGSYLNMDGSYLEDKDYKEKTRSMWEQGINDLSSLDPRVQWTYCRNGSKGNSGKNEIRGERRDWIRSNLLMLQHLRVQLASDLDLELVMALTKLEVEVRHREKEDAIAWKRRSQVRWFSMGDAPSSFCFAQMRAK